MISLLLYVVVLMAISILASDAFQNIFYITQKVANPSSSSLPMATWSNGQAIQEYKDFLATGISFVCFYFVSVVLIRTYDMNT